MMRLPGPVAPTFLLLLLPAAFAPAQDQGGESAAEPGAVETFFRETRHLQAGFTQLEFDADGVLRRESSGRLYLSRPGRFRLDYVSPDEVAIWADGEHLSVFDRELEQVTVWKQTARLKESAAALLAGEASALERYRIGAPRTEGAYQWFDLSDESAAQGNVGLAFLDGAPAAIEYSDEFGSRVRMLLHDLDRTSAIDEALFDPDIPPGVDIFEAAES